MIPDGGDDLDSYLEGAPAEPRSFVKARWLCLCASLLICVCAGFGYAWSVLQTPIVAAYGWPDGQVSLAYTATVVCSTMAPLLFSPLIRRLGTRRCILLGAALFGGGLFCTGLMSGVWQLYLCYGVLSGLGCGFIYPSMMAYVVRLFPERSGMASGLGTAAYGSGAILWAPVAVGLTDAFSIAMAFRVLGAAFLAVIAVASLLLREPPEGFGMPGSAGGAHAGSGLRRGEMVKTGTFYLMVAVFTCGLVAGVIVISQASPILQQAYGFSAASAAVFVSVFAACNMAGRFLWGSLSDRLGIRNTVAAVFALCILAMLVLAITGSTAAAVCAMGLAASCYGGFASVLTPLTARMFGARYITENYGVMYVVFGLASLIGPALAVRFKNAAGGSYAGAFLTAAVLAAVGLVLSRFLKPNAEGEQHGNQ
ncbi:MAG: MFS transporter [Clostridia bacterium]|nr:MFS transporter [Clostridia bacterium]